MRIVHGIGVPLPLPVRRKGDQANWPIAVIGAFIPGDEKQPITAVGLRVEDLGDIDR